MSDEIIFKGGESTNQQSVGGLTTPSSAEEAAANIQLLDIHLRNLTLSPGDRTRALALNDAIRANKEALEDFRRKDREIGAMYEDADITKTRSAVAARAESAAAKLEAEKKQIEGSLEEINRRLTLISFDLDEPGEDRARLVEEKKFLEEQKTELLRSLRDVDKRIGALKEIERERESRRNFLK